MKNDLMTIFLFLFSFSLAAQTYQAPKFDFKSAETPEAEVRPSQKDDWRSNYKIENRVQPQRELASEEDDWVDFSEREGSRDPSSVTPKPMNPDQNPNVRPWLWSGE